MQIFLIDQIIGTASVIGTPEHAHRWGMYHCTAGLQFYKVVFNCFTRYIQITTYFLHWSVSFLLNWRPADGQCSLSTHTQLENYWTHVKQIYAYKFFYTYKHNMRKYYTSMIMCQMFSKTPKHEMFYLVSRGIPSSNSTCICTAGASTCQPLRSRGSLSLAWPPGRPCSCSRWHSSRCRPPQPPIEWSLETVSK